MMSRIINSLSNADLIKVVIAISAFLFIVISIMMKFYSGYGGLIKTIYYVMFFLFFFFSLVLIFFDKEEAKNYWIFIGLGYLAGFWGIFG